ncbi:glycosyltransferase [Streptomyces sannanensis]
MRRNVPTLMDELYRLFQKKAFPEQHPTWIPGVPPKAVTSQFKKKFDLIIATGHPFVSFAAAQMLGKLLKISYVADYRDAWTLNQFTENLIFDEGGKSFEWEAKVLRDTSETVFVNDGMRQWHIDRYPDDADRMTVVPNGWEPEPTGEQDFVPPAPNRPPRFGYLGTITSHMPLEELFDGCRIARSNPVPVIRARNEKGSVRRAAYAHPA